MCKPQVQLPTSYTYKKSCSDLSSAQVWSLLQQKPVLASRLPSPQTLPAVIWLCNPSLFPGRRQRVGAVNMQTALILTAKSVDLRSKLGCVPQLKGLDILFSLVIGKSFNVCQTLPIHYNWSSSQLCFTNEGNQQRPGAWPRFQFVAQR